MRTFMVLCLIALATADKLGYNYQPVGHGDGNYGRGENILSGQIGGGSVGGGSFGGGSVGGGSVGGGSVGGGDGGFEKEFYSFHAHEADFDQPDAAEQISDSLKKSLQVIFIKGPENKGLENAALSLAKHASEQRTAIYVLNKQTDIGELANKLNTESSHNHQKPEVHFVKYRTPEDAQNAQHQIQSQYAGLEGPSQSHDGGVAPVLDFASKGHIGGGQEGQGGFGGQSGQGGFGGQAGQGGFGGQGGQGTYLPPNFRRVK